MFSFTPGARRVIYPTYDDLEQALTRVDAVHQPAEVHGILCGLLIHQSSIPVDTFVGIILGKNKDGDALKSEARALLKTIHASTLEQLHDPDLGFELLLPDDESPVDARIKAVTDWVGGLIYGLAQQGVNSFRHFSEDTGDFLTDCREIASGEYEMEGSEEDENIYLELVEYLRVGTLMVQEEMQPTKAPPQIH